MLPKWYREWNRANPVDIYKPVIIFGGIGCALIVVALLVSLGQPFETSSIQTGPRGNGMSVTKFNTERLTPDPDIELLAENPPYVPEGGEELAGDIYENVQVLGDLTEDNFNRVMAAITEWVAPEEGCAYCHGDVDLEEYGNDDLYTKVVARNMIQMTQFLNEEWGDHVNAYGEAGVTCFTCHRGQNVPSDIWFDIAPVNERVAGWGAVQNRATVQSSFTSLPSDALMTYLVEGEIIGVHDLDSRVDGVPGVDDYPGIQHAERTYSLMNYVANSLGVNCVFCHNSRAFYDASQVTPQWGNESLGIQMVIELNNDWLLPLHDVYPPERLGPINADAPKAACRTCHKGYQRPLQGAHVIADWPELAASGPPDYSAFEEAPESN